MIKKILIANRGEIALRIIRTCKELGINTVAIYSTEDKDSLHIRFADEAVCVGPPPSTDSYLNIPRIIAAAEITNADAIHPGYGFLAENAEFAEICADSNLIFIGPTPAAIRKMGNKSEAKQTMKEHNIPVIPGSDGVINDLQEAMKFASTIGFPIMLKAAAGGGGTGMKVVYDSEQFERLFTLAKIEAKNAFGNDDIYIEKLIENPRHIEFQVLADKFGNVAHLWERDCTIQRRHQKLIEETPSPFIDNEVRQKMAQTAIQIAKVINYLNAGTIEFLVDKNRNFYFMEMNTRIQVEHPITEVVTNKDLVKEQILIASGEKLSFKSVKSVGHSIECRINAEDPDNNFRSSPGLITAFHLPGGTGIRVDTHCYSGYRVPKYYDSLLAKLVVRADNREDAIKRMNRALNEFVIEGIKTTIPLYIEIMNDKHFVNGDYDTTYIDKMLSNRFNA
ncbi:MAG: acetyl-CoA carboxylase biotin carboxylase subunit [Ignavibacteria bacterium]